MQQNNGKYFFYPTPDEKGRTLPGSAGRGDTVTLASDEELGYFVDEGEYRRLSARITEELCSPAVRERSLATATPLSVVFSLLADFCEPYPLVSLVPEVDRAPSVSVCLHSALFSLGTLVHAAVARGVPLTVSREGDEAAISFSVPVPSRDEAGVARAFGLHLEGRLPVIREIAGNSGMTLSLVSGEVSRIRVCFTRGQSDLLSFRAGDGVSLHAAFMLPLRYFTF